MSEIPHSVAAADTAPQTTSASSVPRKRATDAIVDRWHAETFPGTIAGNTVEMWNLITAAKEDLKRRLNKEFA